jgi:hypothetical protein
MSIVLTCAGNNDRSIVGMPLCMIVVAVPTGTSKNDLDGLVRAELEARGMNDVDFLAPAMHTE